MKKFITTNNDNTAALIARLAVAIAIFPHGAQKLFGWFGGYGFSGSMHYFTETVGVPWILGFLVIMVETFAPILLIAGLFTRYAAVAIAFNFIGVLITSIELNRFFMNWYAVGGQGEGVEYFILLFGLVIILLITGGGKASIDATLIKDKK